MPQVAASGCTAAQPEDDAITAIMLRIESNSAVARNVAAAGGPAAADLTGRIIVTGDSVRPAKLAAGTSQPEQCSREFCQKNYLSRRHLVRKNMPGPLGAGRARVVGFETLTPAGSSAGRGFMPTKTASRHRGGVELLHVHALSNCKRNPWAYRGLSCSRPRHAPAARRQLVNRQRVDEPCGAAYGSPNGAHPHPRHPSVAGPGGPSPAARLLFGLSDRFASACA